MTGDSTETIANTLGVSNTTVTQARKALGVGLSIDKSKAAIAERHYRMRSMAAGAIPYRRSPRP